MAEVSCFKGTAEFSFSGMQKFMFVPGSNAIVEFDSSQGKLTDMRENGLNWKF
jgi:hypothetical protein